MEDTTDKFFHMTYRAMSSKAGVERYDELKVFYSKNANNIDFAKFFELANEKWCTPFNLNEAIEIERGSAHY